MRILVASATIKQGTRESIFRRPGNLASPTRSRHPSSREIIDSISAGSVELWSGAFFIGDGADSTRRAAWRLERWGLF